MERGTSKSDVGQNEEKHLEKSASFGIGSQTHSASNEQSRKGGAMARSRKVWHRSARNEEPDGVRSIHDEDHGGCSTRERESTWYGVFSQFSVEVDPLFFFWFGRRGGRLRVRGSLADLPQLPARARRSPFSVLTASLFQTSFRLSSKKKSREV